MTFSIVAWDQQTREWGIGVASKFLAAGAVVPWAKAGIGAVATQAQANVSYGPRGLELLQTRNAAETVELLTEADDERQHRQVAVVDGSGGTASYTGRECYEWAGSVSGPGFSCQGNILAGPAVVEAMATAFEHTTGELFDRLLSALHAGDDAGGDRRGKQSAAMLVVREDGGYLGGSDVAVDLRVDDHSEPVGELSRLLDVHRLLFPNPATQEFVPIDDATAVEISRALARVGFNTDATTYGTVLQRALSDWMGMENLEMRWSEGPQIDAKVLALLLGGQ